MPAISADTVAIYRASIVGAVKRSSVLMADLVRQVRDGWPEHDATADVQKAAALQLLIKYESRLVAQYPLAMLELFAQGAPVQAGGVSATGKLIEIGRDDTRLRVEMVRARQRIAREAAPALSELDTLIGAAQGFDRVQPERNPLRPGNYVRALFGVVYGASVQPGVARLWLTSMQEELGGLLAREYLRVSEELRARGVQPLHYVTAGRSRFTDLAEDRSVPARGEAVESFLAPIGQEALPGIDSSMWDSLRSASTLSADAISEDHPRTMHAPNSEEMEAAQRRHATRGMPQPHSGNTQWHAVEAGLVSSADSGAGTPEVSWHGGSAPAVTGAPPVQERAAEPPISATGSAALEDVLAIGDWVNIIGAHGTVRTQLTWLSPRRTLFLFTQADGSTQSMTSRMVSRLLQSGAMTRTRS